MGLFEARRRNTHVDQPKTDGGGGRNNGPIPQTHEIDPRPRRRRLASCRRLPDADANAGRHHRRRMRDVILVSQQQLQCVLAGRQRDLGFGLAGAVMQMIEVARYRPIERRQFGVDQQVMVAGMLAWRACRRHFHVPQPELDVVLAGTVAPSLRSTK